MVQAAGELGAISLRIEFLDGSVVVGRVKIALAVKRNTTGTDQTGFREERTVPVAIELLDPAGVRSIIVRNIEISFSVESQSGRLVNAIASENGSGSVPIEFHDGVAVLIRHK